MTAFIGVKVLTGSACKRRTGAHVGAPCKHSLAVAVASSRFYRVLKGCARG